MTSQVPLKHLIKSMIKEVKSKNKKDSNIDKFNRVQSTEGMT